MSIGMAMITMMHGLLVWCEQCYKDMYEWLVNDLINRREYREVMIVQYHYYQYRHQHEEQHKPSDVIPNVSVTTIGREDNDGC